MTSLLDTALAYHRAGLVVLPNDARLKYPAQLKGWQTVQPTKEDILRWFKSAAQVAIGVRDIEGLDFDNKGSPDAETLYKEWAALVERVNPGLVDRLLLEQTPSGGFHAVWRCEEIAGNQRLATRPPTTEERKANEKLTSVTLIETRGKGGQFQVAPSPGYRVLRGAWTALPVITPAERAILLDCAKALTQTDARTISLLGRSTGERAGDRFNQEGIEEALDLLIASGWSIAYTRADVHYLTRPDKAEGISATFGYVAPGILYVFSSNASPFQAEKAYTPFAIYAELKHAGDYKAAAKALYARQEGKGERRIDLRTGEIIDRAEAPLAREVSGLIVPKAPTDINDLLAMERKPTIWYAQNFLREGLGLLVGQPNVGKTPLAAQLAIAIALGNKWMGQCETRQAKVLYLGMEYSAQELIPLFDISRCGQKIPRGQLLIKTIEDEFPTTAEEALADLEWYIRALGVGVIIIDVLTAFLPPEKFKQNVYRGDYSELKPYHRLALQYNASILGVWHASKRESDPRLMYNGSTGMWAAAASRITMYQDQEQRVRIASFARMADKVDWALAQEQHLAGRRWVVADAAPEPMMSEAERILWRWLKENSDKTNAKQPATIADMTGLPPNTVKGTLRRMFEKNLIQQSAGSSGYFMEKAVTPVTLVTGVTDKTDVTHVSETGYKDLQQEDAVESPGYNGYTVTPVSDDPTPLDVMPPSLHATTRMMLVSDLERNIEQAKARCAEYGLDYEATRKWALDKARKEREAK
jgi:DNA-binding CsgD family transcriptional regulator